MGKARLIAGCSSLVCTLVLFGARLCYGQATSGEITGKIADASGAVIPGVEVTATNAATGVTRTVVSETSGIYRIPQLPPGTYTLKSALTGFKTAMREAVTVSVRDVIHVDLTLEVGSISEIVTVSEEASLVNTEQGRVSTLVDSK